MLDPKYRIWGIKQKKYLPLIAINFDSKEVFNGVTVSLSTDFRKTRYWRAGETRSFILEPYAGLGDKNGRKIYEGDIVKARWRRAKNARLDTQGEVKFTNGQFYVKDAPDGQDRFGIPLYGCYDVEVVGNIHENEDLLNPCNSTDLPQPRSTNQETEK